MFLQNLRQFQASFSELCMIISQKLFMNFVTPIEETTEAMALKFFPDTIIIKS